MPRPFAFQCVLLAAFELLVLPFRLVEAQNRIEGVSSDFLLLESAAMRFAKDDSITRTHVYRGRLLHPDGTPAADAIISNHALPNGLRQWITDANGDFEIRLPAEATHPPFLAKSHTSDSMSWIAVQRKNGMESFSFIEDLKLIKLLPPKQYSVHVVDKGGQPIEGADIVLRPLDGVQAHGVTTNREGDANIVYPSDMSPRLIGAIKPGQGCDYRVIEPLMVNGMEIPHDNSRIAKDHVGVIQLVLGGAQSVSVTAIDGDGRPIPGIELIPDSIQIPDRRDRWPSRTVAGENVDPLVRVTDDQGVAVFDFIPLAQTQSIRFGPRQRLGQWKLDPLAASRGRYNIDSRIQPANVTLNFEKPRSTSPDKVSGELRFPDGRPAANVRVLATGRRMEVPNDISTRTDANGRWELNVNPYTIYHFLAKGEGFASTVSRQYLYQEPSRLFSLDNIELEPAKRVFGKVIGQAARTNIVTLAQRIPELEVHAAERIPRHASYYASVYSAFLIEQNQVLADGSFEFHVGPGDYLLRCPDGRFQRFLLTDSNEREVNLRVGAEKDRWHRLSLVANGGSNPPVANAKVIGIGTKTTFPGYFSGLADAAGIFDVDADWEGITVIGYSPDRALAGSIKITQNDTQATLKMFPTTKITGRLVDQEKSAIAFANLDYHIQIPGMQSDSIGLIQNSTQTDVEGNFTLSDLCMDTEYQVSVQVALGRGPKIQYRTLMSNVVPSANAVRPMVLVTDRAGLLQPRLTLEQSIAKSYQHDIPFQTRLNQASALSKETGTKTLVVTKNSNELLMATVFKNYERSEFRNLIDRFRVVYVDPKGETDVSIHKSISEWLGGPIDERDVDFIVLDSNQRKLGAASIRKMLLNNETLDSFLSKY